MWYGMVCGGIVEVWCVVVWLRYGVWWLVSGGMVEVWYGGQRLVWFRGHSHGGGMVWRWP